MALGAGGCDYSSVTPLLLGKEDQRSIVGVIQVDRPVAGVTIKPEGRERPGYRVHRGGVTTSTSIRETVLVPGRLLYVDPLLNLAAASEFGLCVEYCELSVTLILKETESMTASKEVFDLRRDSHQRRLTLENVLPFRRVFGLANGNAVSVLLPARADVVAMTEETLVTVDEVWDRFTGVAASPGGRVDGFLSRRACRKSGSMKRAQHKEGD
jgi:hypothetical protein